MNACWKKIWPECANSDDFVTEKSEVFSEIIALSNAIGDDGFNDVDAVDIEELMRESPLNDGELIYAVADNGNKDDENDEIEGKCLH